MRLSPMRFAIRALLVLFAGLAITAVCHGQMAAGGQQASPVQSGTDSMQTELHMLTDVQRQGIDRKEMNAYKAFYEQKDELEKKIQLGHAFLQAYPKSALAEAVDAGLMNAYVAKQDWKNVYASADSALALKPDDVDVLTTVGWVIPHVYHPDDPDASSELDKAETYEKHAIDVMTTMPKPSTLTDAQFAALKAQKSAQAHSALGLVYFRRENYENSAKELQQVMQGNSNPDSTDLYVLGMDLQNLKRYGEAADAFSRCAQTPGALQDPCKENADVAKKQSAQSK
jgi:tetratricopeptide (TPR) repeat protein